MSSCAIKAISVLVADFICCCIVFVLSPPSVDITVATGHLILFTVKYLEYSVPL